MSYHGKAKGSYGRKPKRSVKIEKRHGYYNVRVTDHDREEAWDLGYTKSLSDAQNMKKNFEAEQKSVTVGGDGTPRVTVKSIAELLGKYDADEIDSGDFLDALELMRHFQREPNEQDRIDEIRQDLKDSEPDDERHYRNSRR